MSEDSIVVAAVCWRELYTLFDCLFSQFVDLSLSHFIHFICVSL